MAKYGFDEENAKYIPEQYVQSEHIAAYDSPLGHLVDDYMNKTVTKILLAKNEALLKDRTRQLADELKMQDTANDSDEELNENYLKAHIVRDAKGNPITDEKAMSEWVKNTFHFALSDIDSENAWIFDDKKHDKKTIAITTKMLEFAENSSQLEGIIAHELGHYFVSERYEHPKPAINEKMADQHALDCLYYMGKSPDEYGIVFEKLFNIYEMNETEKILAGLDDEHGSPTSRLQDIDNYNEAIYGDYIEELDDTPENVARINADDKEFSEFKEAFQQIYAQGRYIGTLEQSLMEEEELKPFIQETTGRIDITQIPYEKVLDILIKNADDQHFCSTQTLDEAAYLLSHSSKTDLELNDRITQKVNTFIEKAGISTLLNGHNYKQETLKQDIRNSNYKNLNSEYAQTSIARILIKEAEAEGQTIAPEQMAEKIEQILLENNLTITNESQLMTYQGQQFWLRNNAYDAIFLLLDKPNSPTLSPEVQAKRGEILNNQNFQALIKGLNDTYHHSEQRAFIESLDNLTFAAAYPTLDLDAYKKDYATAKNDTLRDEKEADFLNKVITAEHITVKPISTYHEIIAEWQSAITNREQASLSSYPKDMLPVYSHLAMDLPSFEMPSAEKAIGETLPWNHIKNNDDFSYFGLTKEEHVNQTQANAQDFAPAKEFKHFKDIISLVKFSGNQPYDFIADEQGKIIAIGEEANALRQQKITQNKQQKSSQISEHMEESIKTLNALTAVSLLSQKSKTTSLNEKETKVLESSLHYLAETPNLEPHLMGQWLGYNNERSTIDAVKELNYENMPASAPEIEKNFEKLKESIFYRTFYANDNNEPLTAAQKKERLVDIQNWQFKDNTTKILQSHLPIISKVMEMRTKRSQEKNDKFHFLHEKFAWQLNLTDVTARRIDHCSDKDKASILPQILHIKTKIIEKTSNLLELNEKIGKYFDKPGAPNDELVYTSTQSPYYEIIRQKLNLRETKGNPNFLYANLTAKIETTDEIAPNYDENIQQRRNDKDFKNTDTGRFWSAGEAKLNSLLTSDDRKIAEYEVMRYINEPSNPPLDCQKLLTAFPRYGYALSPFETAPGCTDAFCKALGDYILNKSNFKDLDFYQQREVYELMLHKNLFDKSEANKFTFLEEIKKSYQELPEAEKAAAALSILQDKTFTYSAVLPKGSYGEDSECDFRISKETETKTMADFPPIRNYFAAEYAERFSKQIGIEPIIGEEKPDGSFATEKDYQQYQEKITAFINMVNETTTAAPDIKEALFAQVADKIEAQAETAKRFEVGSKHIESQNDMSGKNEIGLRLTSSINAYLSISPKNNQAVIDFLTAPYSPESAEDFKQKLYENTLEVLPFILASGRGEAPQPLDENTKEMCKSGIYELTNEDLCITHADFWDKTLEERSVVMQRLLENMTDNNIDKSVDLVIDKYLKPEEPYYKEAKDVLKTLYKTGSGVGHYRKNKARFMLGAMLSAQEPTKETASKNIGIGQALALFCSSNGPAWVKFGQALSNIPNLPDDIRKPLSILKDRAVVKKRWELFEELEQNLPKEKFATIKRVGKILGAGSFFSSVGIELKDNSKHVLQMMAPQAPKKAKSEFKKILRTIKDLTSIDKMYAVLDKIVERADESTKTEVNIQKGYEQYVEAAKNYAMIDELEVNGIKFKLHLVPWTDKHQDENGNGFKQMEFADGKSLSRIDCTPDEKKALASGYVATELGILLGGKAWDIDRHNGQQNFNVTRDENGKITAVEIGIFDTGALRPAPEEQDKALIANFYAAVLRASIKGDDINDVMFKEVQNLEDKGINASYVSDVQRGCIALSDLCEYQKEERDEKGKITQAAQSFSQGDYLSIFGAVINSGLIDHKIMDPLLTTLVKDKKVMAAIVKQQVQQKFAKLRKIITRQPQEVPQDTSIRITMSAKGCIATKQQNMQIDQAKANPEDNAFRTQAQTKMTKQEKHGNKLSRMLQAAYIKHTRHNK